MKKLYVVSIEVEVVVIADDEEDAREAASDALHEMDSFDHDYNVQPMRFLPGGWDGGEIPFGTRDDDDDGPEKDVNAWIAAGAAPELTRRMAEKEAKRSTPTGSVEPR